MSTAPGSLWRVAPEQIGVGFVYLDKFSEIIDAEVCEGRCRDCSVIALWLGHESIETTQTYLHAHLALKETALAKLKPYERGKRIRFQANDRLLAFLEAL